MSFSTVAPGPLTATGACAVKPRATAGALPLKTPLWKKWSSAALPYPLYSIWTSYCRRGEYRTVTELDGLGQRDLRRQVFLTAVGIRRHKRNRESKREQDGCLLHNRLLLSRIL